MQTSRVHLQGAGLNKKDKNRGRKNMTTSCMIGVEQTRLDQIHRQKIGVDACCEPGDVLKHVFVLLCFFWRGGVRGGGRAK